MKFDFTYCNIPYRYEHGDIYDALGNYVCRADISCTEYATNKLVITICCHCALKAYEEGELNGKNALKKQMRELLGVETNENA